MGDEGGFWNTVGPYMGGAIVILIGVIFADIKADIKWLKRNMVNILAALQVKAEGD
jgi:hypothetical protein